MPRSPARRIPTRDLAAGFLRGEAGAGRECGEEGLLCPATLRAWIHVPAPGRQPTAYTRRWSTLRPAPIKTAPSAFARFRTAEEAKSPATSPQSDTRRAPAQRDRRRRAQACVGRFPISESLAASSPQPYNPAPLVSSPRLWPRNLLPGPALQSRPRPPSPSEVPENRPRVGAAAASGAELPALC